MENMEMSFVSPDKDLNENQDQFRLQPIVMTAEPRQSQQLYN